MNPFCQNVVEKERTSSQIWKLSWLERSPVCRGVSLLNQASKCGWSTAINHPIDQFQATFPCSNFEHLQWVTMPARSDQGWWGEGQVSAILKNSSQSSHLIFRFVAVFCFSTKAGVKNSAKVNNVCKSNWSNHFSLFPVIFILNIHELTHILIFLCRCKKCSGAVSLISDYWFVSLATYTATIL